MLRPYKQDPSPGAHLLAPTRSRLRRAPPTLQARLASPHLPRTFPALAAARPHAAMSSTGTGCCIPPHPPLAALRRSRAAPQPRPVFPLPPLLHLSPFSLLLTPRPQSASLPPRGPLDKTPPPRTSRCCLSAPRRASSAGRPRRLFPAEDSPPVKTSNGCDNVNARTWQPAATIGGKSIFR